MQLNSVLFPNYAMIIECITLELTAQQYQDVW